MQACSRWPILAVAPAFVPALPVPAGAQALTCGDRDDILSVLAEDWLERPVGTGLTSDGGLVVITASADGETWTLMVIRPDGTGCMIGAGTAWDTAPFPAAGVNG